jgi:outer membrane protein, heavy metal efflux system
MKIIINSILALFFCITLNAQSNINSVLKSIEENNATLKTLRENVKVEKYENSIGITLEDPEVVFNYLWGSPLAIGNRTDFSFNQKFDIPTITGMKSRNAKDCNALVEWQFKISRMYLLVEAKQYCIELIYYNALRKECEVRLNYAETIFNAYQKRMNNGDVNILEYNKVKLYLSMTKGEMSRIDVERQSLLSQLKRLNGGQTVVFEDLEFPYKEIPTNFDEWFYLVEQKNPLLSYIKQEIEIKKNQVSLSKAMWLPVFSVGIMSETVVGQRYQGVSVGVSIPLWKNKNQVKYATTAVSVAVAKEFDNKQQFYNQIQTLYFRTIGLKNISNNYRKSLEGANNSELLKKALDEGEISLLDYILELGIYYNLINQTLEAERDYQKAYVELYAVEL